MTPSLRWSRNVQVVAEVGDIEISPQALNREYMFEISRMEQLFGQRLDREKARAFGLLEDAGKPLPLIEKVVYSLEKDER